MTELMQYTYDELIERNRLDRDDVARELSKYGIHPHQTEPFLMDNGQWIYVGLDSDNSINHYSRTAVVFIDSEGVFTSALVNHVDMTVVIGDKGQDLRTDGRYSSMWTDFNSVTDDRLNQMNAARRFEEVRGIIESVAETYANRAELGFGRVHEIHGYVFRAVEQAMEEQIDEIAGHDPMSMPRP
jgi:hypothetical protein